MKESTDSVFLIDTNVLIYAYDKTDKKKHSIAKKLLEKCWRREATFAISIQNLAEFFVVVTQKVPSKLTVEKAGQIISDITEFSHWRLLRYDEHTLKMAINIHGATKQHFWDALISATMLKEGVLHIYTENIGDFKRVEHIHAINPFA